MILAVGRGVDGFAGARLRSVVPEMRRTSVSMARNVVHTSIARLVLTADVTEELVSRGATPCDIAASLWFRYAAAYIFVGRKAE